MSDEPIKKTYSQALVRHLKAANIKKPEDCSWSDWMGPRGITERHRTIALMRAHGATNQFIAQRLGINGARLTIILNTDRMKTLVEQYRKQIYGTKLDEAFRDLSQDAVNLYSSVIRNPQERSSIKLKVADAVLNRHLGKPKESIEVKTSTVRDLFEELDKIRRGDKLTLDQAEGHIQSETQLAEKPIIDVEVKHIQPNPSESTQKSVHSNIDSWLDENIPVELGIGAVRKGDKDGQS